MNHAMAKAEDGDAAVAPWDSCGASPGDGDCAKSFTLPPPPPPPPAPSARNQLQAMLWRQWLFKRRGTGQTFMELVSPILMLLLLVLGWTRTSPVHQDTEVLANASLPVFEEFTDAILGSEHFLETSSPPAVPLQQQLTARELGLPSGLLKLQVSQNLGNVGSKSGFNFTVNATVNDSLPLSRTQEDFTARGEGGRRRGRLEERLGELVFRVLEDGLGIDLQNPSPVTRNLHMVASPVPVLSCIALYIGTVWLWSSHITKCGRKPRKEDPLPLRCLVIVHNLFLCALSSFMGIGLLVSARQLGYSMWGNGCRGDETEMGFLIYIFYLSKLYEFMDTAIMLFRRNLRQLTYLHIYHHASITFIWWIICYTHPGGDAYFSAAFNSCIHVAMYLYYLLAATVAKDSRRRRKYLFWGKYLTMMQMVQFLFFIGQSIYAMLRPETYPRGMPRLLFFYSVSLLAFFGNFFVRKYSRPQKSGRAD